ncbi:MAG: hypothetical protein ACRCWG_14240 [Sarcina sp.]
MRKIVIAFTLISVCAGFVSCGNKKSTEVTTTNQGRILTKTDSEVKAVSGGDYVSKEVKKESYYEKDIVILKDRIISLSEKSGLDIIYDDKRKDYIEPQNDGFYITHYIANDDFLIWIESNVKDIGKGDVPLIEEYIYSRNLETGEFAKVDHMKYNSLEHIYRGIRELDISENNNIVYKYFKENKSGKVEQRVVLYNLEKKFQKQVVVDTNEDILIENINIGLNNIVYIMSEFDNKSAELTRQKLINYTIDDGEIEEIDVGLEIKNLDVYDNEIAFISSDEDENLELYIYDLKSSRLTSRVFKDSNLSKYYEKIGGKLDYSEGNLVIDESYVYMLGQSSVVYDLEGKKFIVLENDLSAINYDYVYSKKVGDKTILVIATKGEEKVITEYMLK